MKNKTIFVVNHIVESQQPFYVSVNFYTEYQMWARFFPSEWIDILFIFDKCRRNLREVVLS